MNIPLSPSQQIKINSSFDLYEVMRQILLREQNVDQDREHFWTVCLDSAHKILNIELVSLGSVKATLVEPMEVLSIPLQKRAVKLILVHNHPSGEIQPSEADKDITDLLIQCGKIMHVPVVDHLIITPATFYSFADSGLLGQLEQSEKYVPPYLLKRKYEQDARKKASQAKAKGKELGEKTKATEMARVMKQKGYPLKEIAELTGLSEHAIKLLKTD